MSAVPYFWKLISILVNFQLSELLPWVPWSSLKREFTYKHTVAPEAILHKQYLWPMYQETEKNHNSMNQTLWRRKEMRPSNTLFILWLESRHETESKAFADVRGETRDNRVLYTDSAAHLHKVRFLQRSCEPLIRGQRRGGRHGKQQKL